MPIVYVLSNPAMPGLVKIGKTTRDDLGIRMRELYSTGVPVPFECEYAVEVEDETALERALHEAFDPNRINTSREFFEIKAYQVIAILRVFGENIGAQVNQEVEAAAGRADIAAGEQMRRTRRPNFDFYEMGLEDGDELVSRHDSDLKVIVCSAQRVRHDDREMSLTRATKTLHENPNLRGTLRHWLFNGRLMRELYNETYPHPEEDD